MLSKGIKNEEDQRINSILERLTTLVFVPDMEGIKNIEVYLNKIGMSFQDLKEFSSEKLNDHLLKMNFNWDHMESFANVLLNWSQITADSDLKEKAKNIYIFIQKESKMFSFALMNKIAGL